MAARCQTDGPSLNGRLKLPDGLDGHKSDRTSVRSIIPYKGNQLLLEINSKEAADWIKMQEEHISHKTLKVPVKILGRTYPVIARFMPIEFKDGLENGTEIEDHLKLNPVSI